MKPSTDRPAYLRPAQAAEFLGLSINTLNAWRWHRRKGRAVGPRFVGPPRAPRYAVEELEAFARGEVEHRPPTVKPKKPRARKRQAAVEAAR